MQILIKGVLCDATYDTPELQSEIDNGIFCPSSKFMRELADANGEDVDILIDSEGGDVFAWNSAVNAIKAYPGNVRIIIGSCAFSEAANLALMCGRTIFVHQNSIMLWHSAMSSVEDGASGELRAEADILDRINRPIIDELLRHGVPEEDVVRGFRDGNALVMGASELVRYGIAQVLGEDTTNSPRLDEALSTRLMAMAKANQRIAAHYARIHALNKTEMDTEKVIPEEEKKVEAACGDEPEKKEVAAEVENPEEKTEEKTEEVTEETKEVEVTEDTEKVDESPETTETTEAPETPETEDTGDTGDTEEEIIKVLETLREEINQLNSKSNDFESKIASLEEKLTEKEVELQDAKKALKAERTKRIGAIAACVSGKSDNPGPTDWPSAIKACGGDRMEAYKKYPDLCKAWTKYSK